jgi:uncharacterized protein YeaO (DUF488 family)
LYDKAGGYCSEHRSPAWGARTQEAATKPDIHLKRAYEPPSPEDGHRVLVDRLWPRGLRKADAAIDRWLKELAPSTALRQWFGHDPTRWEEFGRRYRSELKSFPELLDELRRIATRGRLTLVYAARDARHNDAVVLRGVLAHGLCDRTP